MAKIISTTINIDDRGRIEVNNAAIRYRNFAGEASQFNHAGDRKFTWRIFDKDIADAVHDLGYNVKQREDVNGNAYWDLEVKIKFNARGPKCYLKRSTGNKITEIDEENIRRFDQLNFSSFDMDIRPYDWEVNGKSGRSAYLESCCATLYGNRFTDKYEEGDE